MSKKEKRFKVEVENGKESKLKICCIFPNLLNSLNKHAFITYWDVVDFREVNVSNTNNRPYDQCVQIGWMWL